MREIRLSGSEGGGAESNRFSLPLLLKRPFGAEGSCQVDLSRTGEKSGLAARPGDVGY